MKIEKCYNIGNDLCIPWIFFGTGVVWKYSRNPYLWLKVNLRQLLSTIKHFRMPRELYNNIHITRILKDAYKAGFRGFDTARIYGYSEKAIGKTVARFNDIWINTKCSMMDLERKHSAKTIEGNLAISKEHLCTNDVKSLLLHWPEGDNWLDAYRDIVSEYKNGKICVFGICNVWYEHLLSIKEAGLPLPMLIQNEIHPLNVQKEIREFCKKNNIQIMAHTPTTRMRKEVIENEVLKKIANKYKKSIAQIIIRWHYQNNIIPVVSVTQKKHMKENLDVFDFELTEEEMNLIDLQDKKQYLIKTRGVDDSNYVYNY